MCACGKRRHVSVTVKSHVMECWIIFSRMSEITLRPYKNMGMRLSMRPMHMHLVGGIKMFLCVS